MRITNYKIDIQQIVTGFWRDVTEQNAKSLQNYFLPQALIYWHNTNECFTVMEYIKVNCEYPGSWLGEVERMETMGNLAVSVAKVWLADGSAAFHATSFLKFEQGKIAELNEYWGDDGPAPAWRLKKSIGKPIK